MTPDQLETLRQLCRKYRITFNGRKSPSEWPPAHCGLFTDIRTLGDAQYSYHAELKESRSRDEPWVAHAIEQADRVVEIAERCQRERRNEAGWRFALEPEIFSRFKFEVACLKCGGRTWRSEIEVSIDSIDLEGLPLDQRQNLREPCQCPPKSRHQNVNDTGLNLIFSDRAEEVVEHEELVQLALAKQEHPDRIYGLQQTSLFEEALYSPSKRHHRADGRPVLVGETIRFTPFKQFGEPLLFPFLILEAKSAKGEDFETIQKQTAFPIRTLLKIQEDLRSECKEQVTWQGGPLVWFLSNRGEDWRVAACFVDNSDGKTSYRIFNLWNGDVSSRDGALQLLLIIDYISDWARDIYRPAILRHLQSLSGGNASDTTSFDDSINTLSFNGPRGTLVNRTRLANLSDEKISSTFRDALDVFRPVRSLNTARGVLRYVSPANRPKSKISSRAGVDPSSQSSSPRRRQEREKHIKTSSKSHSSPTRRGNGSKNQEPQRHPMAIDITEDDDPEVQAEEDHLRKKTCIRREETFRLGRPTGSIHSDELQAASSGSTTRNPYQSQSDRQALLEETARQTFTWMQFEDIQARDVLFGKDRTDIGAHDDEVRRVFRWTQRSKLEHGPDVRKTMSNSATTG